MPPDRPGWADRDLGGAPSRRLGSTRLSNIREVAKRAGVSTATVSRVLSHPDVVSPDTRLRVLKAVERLGYAPNSVAKNLRVDELERRSASAFRRVVGALLDLIFCALLSAPIAGAMYLTGSNLQEPRVIAVLAGSVIVVTFIYLTLMTALTGRTWAMRLLSLRVIDTKTGLIPTGGQAIGRSFFYLISLATVVGIFFALLSREGYTIHDCFTRTAVVTT